MQLPSRRDVPAPAACADRNHPCQCGGRRDGIFRQFDRSLDSQWHRIRRGWLLRPPAARDRAGRRQDHPLRHRLQWRGEGHHPVGACGLAVAPQTFGSFDGDLIAPDELSGKIYAIAPDGKVTLVARPALPTGGDIGVESLAFVPEGFVSRGGAAYYPDRLTPGNAHPGTDHLLRLTSDSLGAAGVQGGDILAATEGGASLIAIRCRSSCSIVPVVSTPTKAHREGHLTVTVNAPPPSPTPAPPVVKQSPVPAAVVDFVGQWGIAGVVIILLLGVVAALAVQAFRHRAK